MVHMPSTRVRVMTGLIEVTVPVTGARSSGVALVIKQHVVRGGTEVTWGTVTFQFKIETATRIPSANLVR